jgi:hypothetical protein
MNVKASPYSRPKERKETSEKRTEKRTEKKKKDVFVESKERYVRAKFAMMKMKEIEKRDAMDRRRSEVASQVKDIDYRPWRVKPTSTSRKAKTKTMAKGKEKEEPMSKSKVPKKSAARHEEKPSPENCGVTMLVIPPH